MKTTIPLIFIVIGVGIFMTALYLKSSVSQTTRTFSEYTLLNSSWEKYKEQFINTDGRVVDNSQKGITTSESQSYAMLRAVWIDDKSTFDKVWKWTHENIQLKDKNLFGWRWGKKDDGSYGFLSASDANSASDADTDIALALILANRRWKDDSYLNDAKKIIPDIWKYETDTSQNKRYIIAGSWAHNANEMIINPSYFAPYAWRIFAQIDKKNNWNSLIDPGYELLNRSGKTIENQNGVGLPPDWLKIIKSSGEIKKLDISNYTTDYSYDAIRVPFRISLDYIWNKDPRALSYLQNSFIFLKKEYANKNKMGSSYTHDGKEINNVENASMYATSLGYFLLVDKNLAKKIYQDKILNLYSNSQDNFNKDLPYYDQNWLWFGAALYNNFLQPFNI